MSDEPRTENQDSRRDRTAEIVGLVMMALIMTMFVLDAFSLAQVREVWIWPLLITSAALILGLRKPFKRA